MRVLVCGGRDFDRADVLERTLNAIHNSTQGPITCIIEGGARGADYLGQCWGHLRNIEVETYPANWAIYGKEAGPIRNQFMLDVGQPELVVAFPTKESKGTWDMVRRAEAKNIKTIIVKEEDDTI